MSNILVFSPPVLENTSQATVESGLAEICGFLEDEGYDFDQSSLALECRYLNRYKFSKDLVDLSVFQPERVVSYLQGNEDSGISREVNKLAEILDIESYETIVAWAGTERSVTKRDYRLFIALSILKERAGEDQLVIMCGLELLDEAEPVEFSFVDYVVDGDFEVPLLNIFRHEFEGEELVVEPGVMVERGGEVLCGEPYQHPMEMKPKPYFEPEILEKDAETNVLKQPIIPYQLGRGCSQDCSFCNLFEDQKYQHKSVDKVVKELRQLKERYGYNYFWFADRNLFNDPDYIEDLAERLKEEELDILWGGLGIIVSRDQEFFDTLAEGGCKAIQHGIESASDSVLHRMRKHQTREMIENTLEKEYKAGIKTYALLITDYVDESWEEYNETTEFIKQNKCLYGGRVSSLVVYPDSNQPLYRNPEEFGIAIQESRTDEWMEKSLDFRVPFKDSRRHKLEEKECIKELKRKHLEKTMKKELSLKNFALKHPVTFVKMQARKLYTKNYSGVSHYFV